MTMKVCKNCLRKFDVLEDKEYHPLHDLGDIFWVCIDNVDIDDLCPECREEMGMFTLLGFGQ
jgi:hypothetical protein